MDRQLNSQMSRNKNSIIDFFVIYAFFCSMGFPGNYREFFGGAIGMAIEYSSFILQIAVILFSSADNVMDIKIIDLKKKHLPTYFLLAVFFIQSMIVTPHVADQLISCLRFTMTALFALWVTDRYDIKRTLEFIIAAQTMFVLANLVLYFLFPSIGFYYDEEGRRLFRGLTERKNVLGQELGFGIVLQMALLRLKIDKKEKISLLFWGVLASQLFLLILCQNAGALFTAAIPIAYIFLFEKRFGVRGRFHWGILYIVISVGFLIVAMTILPLFEPFFNSIGKDATLSNRTLIWEGLLEYVQQYNTFTGSGYNMFWRDEVALQNLQNCYSRDSWFRTMTFGAHNILLEMWLDVGLIGVSLYLFTLIVAFTHVRMMPEEHYVICSAIILVLLIRGLTERAYMPASYSTMFLFLMLGLAQNGKAITFATLPRGSDIRKARLAQSKEKKASHKKTGRSKHR